MAFRNPLQAIVIPEDAGPNDPHIEIDPHPDTGFPVIIFVTGTGVNYVLRAANGVAFMTYPGYEPIGNFSETGLTMSHDGNLFVGSFGGRTIQFDSYPLGNVFGQPNLPRLEDAGKGIVGTVGLTAAGNNVNTVAPALAGLDFGYYPMDPLRVYSVEVNGAIARTAAAASYTLHLYDIPTATLIATLGFDQFPPNPRYISRKVYLSNAGSIQRRLGLYISSGTAGQVVRLAGTPTEPFSMVLRDEGSTSGASWGNTLITI